MGFLTHDFLTNSTLHLRPANLPQPFSRRVLVGKLLHPEHRLERLVLVEFLFVGKTLAPLQPSSMIGSARVLIGFLAADGICLCA